MATGTMFFAFAGYARIATLGEEVAEPKSTIPKAIIVSLAITLIVYLVITTTAILTVDVGALANIRIPLTLAVESGRFSFASCTNRCMFRFIGRTAFPFGWRKSDNLRDGCQ